MNRFQHRLRLLIVAGSAASFLGAWSLLAHAGKPTDGTSNQVLLTDPTPTTAQTIPARLPPLDFKAMEAANGTHTLQALPALPPMPSFRMPRFRTGGS